MTVQPIYQRIAEHYRRLIRAGELRPGDWLPTQKQLMELFECSISPVRMAITELEHEGLVESHHGKGVRVTRQSEPA